MIYLTKRDHDLFVIKEASITIIILFVSQNFIKKEGSVTIIICFTKLY